MTAGATEQLEEQREMNVSGQDPLCQCSLLSSDLDILSCFVPSAFNLPRQQTQGLA